MSTVGSRGLRLAVTVGNSPSFGGCGCYVHVDAALWRAPPPASHLHLKRLAGLDLAVSEMLADACWSLTTNPRL